MKLEIKEKDLPEKLFNKKLLTLTDVLEELDVLTKD